MEPSEAVFLLKVFAIPTKKYQNKSPPLMDDDFSLSTHKSMIKLFDLPAAGGKFCCFSQHGPIFAFLSAKWQHNS
jgi:hypothetical protein